MKHTMREHFSMELRAIKMLYGVSPKFFPTVTINNALAALLPYVTVFFSAKILSELAAQRRPGVLWKWVILTALTTGIFSILSAFFKEREETLLDDIWGRKEILFCKKAMSMDFADADKQETRDLRAQIAQNENWSGLGLMNAAIVYRGMVKGVIGILGGVALTVNLFAMPVPESAGNLRILNSPLFILLFAAVLIGISMLAGFLYGKAAGYTNQLTKDATFGNRVFTYVFAFPSNKNNRLDVRIYDQQPLLNQAYSNNNTVFSADGSFGRAARGPMGFCSALASAFPP